MLTSPRFACPPSLLTPLLSPFLYVIPHPVGPNVSLFQARHPEKTALLPPRSILKGLWISDMSIWRRGANWFCLPHSNAWLYQRADTIQKLLYLRACSSVPLAVHGPLPPQELLSSLPVGLDGGSGHLSLCSLWCLCTVGKCMFVYRQINNKKLVFLRCNYFLVISISFLLNHNCASRP